MCVSEFVFVHSDKELMVCHQCVREWCCKCSVWISSVLHFIMMVSSADSICLYLTCFTTFCFRSKTAHEPSVLPRNNCLQKILQ